MAKDGSQPGQRKSKAERRAEKDLRKHLKRLEGELTAASKAEARRLRKLEKARWRRQRIEAFLDEARTTAVVAAPAVTGAVAAPEAEPAPGPAATSARPRPKPAGRGPRAGVAPEPAPSDPATLLRRRVWPPSRKRPGVSPE